MAETVICRACGAKLKAGRKRCLRCGEALAVSSEAPLSILSRLGVQRGSVLIAGSVVSVLGMLVIAIGRLGGENQPATIAPAAATPHTTSRPTQTNQLATEPRFLDPKNGGTVAYAQGDYPTALDRYRKAIDANPNDADALNDLGQVLARTGDPAGAIQYFERAIELYPKVWSYRFNLAHAYGQMGDWARAVTEYRSADALFPEDYVTQFNLAMALHKQGLDDQAVAGYQKAIALAPGEPSFLLSLGVSYEKLNRPNDAVESYRRYLELVPEAPDAQRVQQRIQALTGPVAAGQGSPPPAPAKPG